MPFTQVDLFSGIGGFLLAGRQAGFEPILMCEIEPYCQSVLREQFPRVKLMEDIHDVGAESVPKGQITVVTGGFPFQTNNSRGEARKGDPRSLWDQFVRVVYELSPTWVLAETVPRFSDLGLDDALWDLERAGYPATAILLPAHAIDCPLRKDRLYIIGARSGDPRSDRLGEPQPSSLASREYRWPSPGPRVCRVAERLPGGLDTHQVRLQAIGNGTVPESARRLLSTIALAELQADEAAFNIPTITYKDVPHGTSA